ncbi:MAG: fumarylacetoacetate hydrolase family protein [Microbacterium sp.]
MRIGRMFRDGMPHFVAQPDPSGPWSWVEGPLSAKPSIGDPVPGGAMTRGLPALAPRLLVGTANSPRPADVGDVPLTVFLKSPHTVVAEGTALTARTSAGVFAEAEIAVVIGRRMSSASASDVFDHVLGYTVVNDATDPGEIAGDPRLFRAKNGSAFTPAGAWIETDFDPAEATITVAVDGRIVATANASDLHVSIAEQLAYISEWTVLEPGDVVMTGCPGTGVMVRPGESVEVAVAGLGSVGTTVRSAPDSTAPQRNAAPAGTGERL